VTAEIDVFAYLKPHEIALYSDYVCARMAHMERGTHIWQRMAAARRKIKFDAISKQRGIRRPDHAILWCDPYNLESPVKVTNPAPQCLADLMIGGVHPPVDAHHESKWLLLNSDGSGDVVASAEADAYRDKHAVVAEHVIDYRRCHDEVLGPLSYDRAIEWILKISVPVRVWGVSHNAPMFRIVPRSSIPSDRTYRNSWNLKDLAA
jgi:hypothetical protein